MARQKKEAPASGGCPAWLATYGDMITLVLTFFVLLYSMSTVDVEKWKALVMNLGGNPYIFDYPQFSANDGSTGSLNAPEMDIEDIVEEAEDWFQPQVVARLEDIINEFNRQQAEKSGNDDDKTGNFSLEYKAGDPYVILRVPNDVLFDSARADLKPEALPYINKAVETAMGMIRAGTVEYVEIQGHADERKLSAGSEFEDNETLSFYRAKNTWQYILDHYDNAYGFFFPSARGAAIPLVNESSEEAWRQNRRVEFYIFKNADYDPAA